jgi:hypothetical protein
MIATDTAPQRATAVGGVGATMLAGLRWAFDGFAAQTV